MLKKLLPPLLALCAGMAAAPAHASDFLWSDTYLSYRYLWQDKQPGTSKDVRENAFNISHADEWKYGSNFVSLDFEEFSHQDPNNCAVCATGAGSSSGGSGEFYGTFQPTLSGNKIFATKFFTFGPVKDVGLLINGQWDTQNDAFGDHKKLLAVGPQFSIDIPVGFWTVALEASHEWGTNGYHANGDTDNFDLVPQLDTAWLVPFAVGPIPLKFTGYAFAIGSKGRGDATDGKHTNEYMAHPKLMVDAGSLLGGAPNKFDVGVGYEYWLNKFGNTSQSGVPGAEQHAVFFEVGYHFD